MVSQDLADSGIEVWDRDLMRTRRWAWLRERIEGLLSRPPVAYIRVPVDKEHEKLSPVWGTRVQELVTEEAS